MRVLATAAQVQPGSLLGRWQGWACCGPGRRRLRGPPRTEGDCALAWPPAPGAPCLVVSCPLAPVSSGFTSLGTGGNSGPRRPCG